MTARIDALVVGAGVVGLAVARALARAGHEVVVTEATAAVGSATSARNSEVIHAGLYYPPGSLKARLCVEGRERLYAYCVERGVPHKRLGKLVVAVTAEQQDGLETIRQRAAACGVELQPLTAADAQAREPALRCHAALWSPRTGIVDSHALMGALRGEAEDHGAMVALQSPVQGAVPAAGGWDVHIGGAEPMTLHTRWLVNAAGLHAQALAARFEGLAPAHVPPTSWARGHYFALPGRPAFSHLVYPLPVNGGLGVHLTLDLAGQMRFGPDVQWLDPVPLGAEDYHVDPALAPAFEAAIRPWWPGLPAGALQPAYAGIRPKPHPARAPAADFVVSGPAEHGLPGLVNLFGIESPGLTAAIVLGELVAQRLAEAAA